MTLEALYCVDHARCERLVPAMHLCDGRSVCHDHARNSAASCVELDLAGWASACVRCTRKDHRTYFDTGTLALCIRHAADQEFEDDDMGAHDMAHAAYISLNEAGVTDAY